MAPPVMRWLRRNGLMVKPEFSLPWGICDLVGVKLDPIKVKRRLSLWPDATRGTPAAPADPVQNSGLRFWEVDWPRKAGQ